MASAAGLVVSVAVLLALPGSALASPELQPQGCIEQTDGLDDCAVDGADGLLDVRAVAATPDGEYVLAAGQLTVSVFSRDGITGDLTYEGCVASVPELTLGFTCTMGHDAVGINGPEDITVSPDGESVYVASFGNNGVAHLELDPGTGQLDFVECVTDTDTPGADCGGNEADGLDGTSSVAVSPDGESVYATSQEDLAISRLVRDPDTGDLTATPEDCIQDDSSVDNCDGTHSSLDLPPDVVVSPDDESVYVTSAFGSDAVLNFDRTPGSGELAIAECFDDAAGNPGGGCADVGSLQDPETLAISPDGESLYVGSRTDNVVRHFSRATADPDTGELTPEGCVDDPEGGSWCDGNNARLLNPRDIAVTPDGKNVYVAAASGLGPTASLTSLSRDAGGELTDKGCVNDEDTGPTLCDKDSPGLEDVMGLAIAGNNSIYTVSPVEDALAMFTRDAVAPDATILTGPDVVTNDNTPTFTFEGDDTTDEFRCSVDSEPFDECSGPGDSHTAAALVDGDHTFEVRATDVAGNTGDAVSQSFTVDATAPQTTITSGPSGPTADSTPSFGFSSTESGSFQCSVDSGAFTSCSSPRTLSSLGDGNHTFRVRARDTATNPDASPATRSFRVDTTGPETEITSGPKPKVKSKKKKAKFSVAFSSEAGASFECSLDGDGFAPCTSPFAGKVKKGAHTVQVRGTDSLGNVESSPAEHPWKVKLKKKK